MNSLIHADIFFFISTVALVIISIGLIIAVIYLIVILRTVSQVSKKVKTESEEILKDVQELRGSIKSNGLKLRVMSAFFTKLFGRRKSSRKE